MNFPQNASKQQKVIVKQYVAYICGEKKFLLIIIPFYWFEPKQLFKQILIFLSICPFQTS